MPDKAPPLRVPDAEQLATQLLRMRQRFGVPIRLMRVAEAREKLPGLIREVVQLNHVVVIRNARRPADGGVVVMSEGRAMGTASRGGMNLAQLVDSFRHSPVKVRSLSVDDRMDNDSETLRPGSLARQAG